MGAHRMKARTLPRPLLPASQQRAVDEFWRRQQEDIEATVDFREHMLPMARLKNVFRAEEDDMMISADTPAFLAKLTELFVQELAMRAWACAQSHQRRIILDSDIAEAVASTESYGFLVGVLLRYLAAQGGGDSASSTPPARLITRKRHRPDPDPAFASRHLHRPQVQFPIIPTPAPGTVHYMPFPRMLPPSSVAAGVTPAAVHGRMAPSIINHVTSDFVFFTNDGNMNYNSFNPFACNNYSAAATMASSARPAGAALQNTPAAYYCFPFPVANNGEPFVVGNTDPIVATAKFMDKNTVNYCGETEGNAALDITDDQRQKQKGGNAGGRHGSVEVEQQDGTAAVGAGEDKPSMCMYVEDEDMLYPDCLLFQLLMDEDMLYPDEDLYLVSTSPGLQDFIGDKDVLDGAFSQPSSSTGSGCN